MTPGLPDTSAVRAPRRWWLHSFAWFGRWAIRRRYRVTVHGAAHVPASGPVILASNHIGIIDGPMLAVFPPRPAHVLTKEEMFRGIGGPFFTAVGQISLWRDGADPGAIKACVKVLRDGHVVGVFPEGTRGAGELEQFRNGAAYLAMVTGAPVVPVTMLGTRDPGGSRSSLPHKGAHLHMVLGEPWTTEQVPWPRTREHVEGVSALLREHLLAQLAHAQALTGCELPGPMPAPGPADPADLAVPADTADTADLAGPERPAHPADTDIATTTVPDQGAS